MTTKQKVCLLDEMRDLNDAGRVLVSLMDLLLADSEDRPIDKEAFRLVTHAHNHTMNHWISVNRKLSGYE